MKQSDSDHANTLHEFIDLWFPTKIAAKLHCGVALLPDSLAEDIAGLIRGQGIQFESINSQRIAVTCLRILGELMLGETLPLIVRAELELTHSCNFNCQYCTARRFASMSPPLLTERRVASLIQLYHNAGCKYLHLNGGEVSLLSYVPELVRMAVSLGMKVGISSNGSGNIEFYRQLVDAGLSYAHISCDSYSPRVFEKLTAVSGAWGWTHGCLAFLCSEARRINPQLSVVANVVLTEETVQSLVSTVRYLIELGVDDIKLMPAFTEHRASTKVKELFQTSIKPAIVHLLGPGNRYPLLRMRLARLFSTAHHPLAYCDPRSLGPCYMSADQAMVRADGVYAPCFVFMSRNYIARDYGMGSISLGLDSRSILARKRLSEPYSTYATCARRCPEMIREANQKIQSVVSDFLAAMLARLDSHNGAIAGRLVLRAERFPDVVEMCDAVAVTGRILWIPRIYEDEFSRILLAISQLGLEVESTGDSLNVDGWEGTSPIVNTLLRLFEAQSGGGGLCYRVVSPQSVAAPEIVAAVTKGGVAPRRILVSLYLRGDLRAQARIVVPPVRTRPVDPGDILRWLR